MEQESLDLVKLAIEEMIETISPEMYSRINECEVVEDDHVLVITFHDRNGGTIKWENEDGEMIDEMVVDPSVKFR